MTFKVQQVPARKIAGFHMVGPWDITVAQGFNQLAVWVKSFSIASEEWLAVYYDNPNDVPPEKLRCDTVVGVPDDFVLPPGSEGVILSEIPGDTCAVSRIRVENNAFKEVWESFFDELEADGGYRPTGRPCYECYLNDGTETGIWDIDMYVPVAKKG